MLVLRRQKNPCFLGTMNKDKMFSLKELKVEDWLESLRLLCDEKPKLGF